MALRSDGTLLVWGAEDVGLRGDGIHRGNSSLPVPTPVTPVSGVTRIALASGTVLVLAPPVIMPHVVGEQRASALAGLHALGLSVHELFVPDRPALRPRRAGGVAEPAARHRRRAGHARRITGPDAEQTSSDAMPGP
jgi:hypothetical protein